MIQNLENKSGFTLIEVVVVLLLIAIMAAAVNALWGDTASAKAYGTARKIQSDIIFAQESAMSRRVHYRVQFNTGANNYTVQVCSAQTSPCPGWSNIIDPSTNTSPFVVTLNTGSYSGVLLSSTTLVCNYVEFNSAGVPMEGSAGVCPTPPVSFAGSRKVTLNPGSRTVTVLAGTGKTSTP